MENLLLEAVTHLNIINKKKPTVKRLPTHINNLGTNNWDEEVVEETLWNLHKKDYLTKIIIS